jgi:hypothetical protein
VKVGVRLDRRTRAEEELFEVRMPSTLSHDRRRSLVPVGGSGKRGSARAPGRSRTRSSRSERRTPYSGIPFHCDVVGASKIGVERDNVV